MKLHYNVFNRNWNKKTFLIKMNMINSILLFLLLLVSMVLLKCASFPPLIHFLNFLRLLHLYVLLIMIFPVSFWDLFSHVVPDDYSCKDTFSFASQIEKANLSGKLLVSYHATSLFTNIPLQETIDIAVNLSFNHNPNLNITKKEIQKLFPFCYIADSFSF